MSGPSDMETAVYGSFDEIPAGGLEAWERQPGLAFDQTLDWYRLLFEHVLSETLEPRIAVVSRRGGEEPLAIAPLGLTKDASLPFGVAGLRSLSNYYSSISEPVLLGAAEQGDVYDALATCVADLGRDGRYVEVEPVPRDGDFFREMSASLKRRGYLLAPYRRFSNWFHITHGESFDDYFAAREGKIRNTFRRKEKKLAAKGYNIVIATDPAEMDRAIADYDAVYRKSWKITESHPGFINALCRRFAEKGWLRLGVLHVDDQPIAAQIWFVHEGVASIFKLSYDEEHKALSAGTILTMALMRHVLDVDEVAKVDYLTGDDPYKKGYMNSKREMWALRAYRTISIAGLYGMAAGLKGALRRRPREERGS